MEHPRIYIVDDSEVIRQRLLRQLNDRIAGISVQTAEGLDDVRASLKDFDPDVIIVDIQLKEGSGFDVLKMIRAYGLHPLVIVLSNYALPPYKEKAFELGARHFLDKSNEFNKAVELIEGYAYPPKGDVL